MFDIETIAQSLSGIRRFTNHTSRPYSVAEHSIMVAHLVATYGGDYTEQLQGLLHDSAESIISDVPTPIKRVCPKLEQIERIVRRCIYDKYYLPHKDSELVERADKEALQIEVLNLFPKDQHEWFGMYNAAQILYTTPEFSTYTNFLNLFRELQRYRKLTNDRTKI